MEKENVLSLIAFFCLLVLGVCFLISFILIPIVQLIYMNKGDEANNKTKYLYIFIIFISIMAVSVVIVYSILKKFI